MGTGRLEPPGLDVDPRAWGVLGGMPLRGRMWLPDSASRLRSPWPGEAATSAEAPVTIVGQTPRPADRQLLGPYLPFPCRCPGSWPARLPGEQESLSLAGSVHGSAPCGAELQPQERRPCSRPGRAPRSVLLLRKGVIWRHVASSLANFN